jgi:hypothetical protein
MTKDYVAKSFVAFIVSMCNRLFLMHTLFSETLAMSSGADVSIKDSCVKDVNSSDAEATPKVRLCSLLILCMRPMKESYWLCAQRLPTQSAVT